MEDSSGLLLAERALGGLLEAAEKDGVSSGDKAGRAAGAGGARHAVGVDCEWRPQKQKQCVLNKCCLLQMATAAEVFLFDLMRLEPGWGGEEGPGDVWSRFSTLVARVLRSSRLLKLGYHLAGDLLRLQQSFPAADHYRGE